MPEYEIKEWNEENFDVKILPYTAEAYEAKKFAFVSDYARFWILYNYGGIYFDTDVEVIKPLDDIIERGPFMGFEKDPVERPSSFGAINTLDIGVNPGLGLGVDHGCGFYKEMLDLYATLSFHNQQGENDLKTIVEYTTEALLKHGLKNSCSVQQVSGIYIYPSEYFCPINITTKRLHITENTYTIHHYMASWTEQSRFRNVISFVRQMLPESFLIWYNRVKTSMQKV